MGNVNETTGSTQASPPDGSKRTSVHGGVPPALAETEEKALVDVPKQEEEQSLSKSVSWDSLEKHRNQLSDSECMQKKLAKSAQAIPLKVSTTTEPQVHELTGNGLYFLESLSWHNSSKAGTRRPRSIQHHRHQPRPSNLYSPTP
jgi:hypothetical protein